MIKINEFLEEEINNMVEMIVAERLKIAIEELSQVKPVQKEFYTVAEVAEILSLTKDGIKRRGKSKKIQLIYDQNTITVHKDELERYKKKYLYKQMKNNP
jgi:hypothetical protein